MSEENVELIQRAYVAFNSGDVEGALALFDPEVEVHLAKDAGTVMGLDFDEAYRGIEGFLTFMGQMSEAFEDMRWEPEGYMDAGDDVVVVFIRMTGKGRRSGVEVDQPMAHLCTMRDGRLVRHETFWERGQALEAAGLSE